VKKYIKNSLVIRGKSRFDNKNTSPVYGGLVLIVLVKIDIKNSPGLGEIKILM